MTAAAISAAAPVNDQVSEAPIANEQPTYDEPVIEQLTYDEPDLDQKTIVTEEVVDSFMQDDQPIYANDDEPADDFAFHDHVYGDPEGQ